MACSICTCLECALASRHTEYIAARTGVFRQISSRLEGYSVVEMERARTELQIHRAVCHSVVPAAIAQLPLNVLKLSSVTGPLVALKR